VAAAAALRRHADSPQAERRRSSVLSVSASSAPVSSSTIAIRGRSIRMPPAGVEQRGECGSLLVGRLGQRVEGAPRR
jgi:hypothetical protein